MVEDLLPLQTKREREREREKETETEHRINPQTNSALPTMGPQCAKDCLGCQHCAWPAPDPAYVTPPTHDPFGSPRSDQAESGSEGDEDQILDEFRGGVWIMIDDELHASSDGMGHTDLEMCQLDPIDELHLEGTGSALRSMFKNKGDLTELMLESGMIEDAGPFHQRVLDLPETHEVHDFVDDDDHLGEIEWAECCEPSYFTAYDQSTDMIHMIADHNGVPIIHDAQRHEQECALNDLVNPAPTWGESTARTEDWEIDNVSFLTLEPVECVLASCGDKFAVGVSHLGAVWVPRSCIPFLPENIGESFHAQIKVSGAGKYPLRVLPKGIIH